MDLKKFLEFDLDFAVVRHLGLSAPLALAVAVAATLGAGVAGKGLLEQKAAIAAQLQLENPPATLQDMQLVATKLKALAPALKVEASSSALLISSNEEGSYPVWSYAVASVPGLSEKYIWTTRNLCVNACGSGSLYRAELVATTQQLVPVVGE